MVLLPEMILLQTKAKLPRYLRAVDAEARRPLQERVRKLVQIADEKIRRNEPMSSGCGLVRGHSWEAWAPASLCQLWMFVLKHGVQVGSPCPSSAFLM